MDQTIRKIAAELNNIGVVLHESEMFREAEDLYREAMQSLLELSSAPFNALGERERQDRYNKWRGRLQEKRDMLQCHTCNTTRSSMQRLGSNQPTPQKRDLTRISRAVSVNFNTSCLCGKQLSLAMLHNLSLVKIHQRQQQSALDMLEMALSLMPREADVDATTAFTCVSILNILGLLLYNLKRVEESMHILANSFQLGHNKLGRHMLVSVTLYILGHIFMARGEIDDAEEAFAEAATIRMCHDTIVENKQSSDSAAPAA